MSSHSPALEILVVGARALAHTDGREARLQIILGSLAGQIPIASGVVFVRSAELDRLEPAASFGLSDPALAGLAAAVGNPGHPISKTVADRIATFDVVPTAPGGPALRSHLPLIVGRNGDDVVVGVMAFAYELPIDPAIRPLLLAAADLAAVAIELP